MASNISASDTTHVSFKRQIPEDVEIDPQQVFDLSEGLQSDIGNYTSSTSVDPSHCSPQNVVMNAQTQQFNAMTKMHGFATNSVFQKCSFYFK